MKYESDLIKSIKTILSRYVQLKTDALQKCALGCSFSESVIENLEKHL